MPPSLQFSLPLSFSLDNPFLVTQREKTKREGRICYMRLEQIPTKWPCAWPPIALVLKSVWKLGYILSNIAKDYYFIFFISECLRLWILPHVKLTKEGDALFEHFIIFNFLLWKNSKKAAGSCIGCPELRPLYGKTANFFRSLSTYR